MSYASRAFDRSERIGFAVWNKLHPKWLFHSLRFPVGGLFEDAYVFPEIASQCKKVAVVNRPLYHYRPRSGSITDTIDFAKLGDLLDAFRNLLDYLARNEDEMGPCAQRYAVEFARDLWVLFQIADMPSDARLEIQALFRGFLRNHWRLVWGLSPKGRVSALIVTYLPPRLAGLVHDCFKRVRLARR